MTTSTKSGGIPLPAGRSGSDRPRTDRNLEFVQSKDAQGKVIPFGHGVTRVAGARAHSVLMGTVSTGKLNCLRPK